MCGCCCCCCLVPSRTPSDLSMCKTVVEDTWNKVFIGGLPCHYTDEQVCVCVGVFVCKGTAMLPSAERACVVCYDAVSGSLTM